MLTTKNYVFCSLQLVKGSKIGNNTDNDTVNDTDKAAANAITNATVNVADNATVNAGQCWCPCRYQ